MPLTLWRLSVSLRPLVQTLESCPTCEASLSSTMSPIPRKGSRNNNISCRVDSGPRPLKGCQPLVYNLVVNSRSVKQGSPICKQCHSRHKKFFFLFRFNKLYVFLYISLFDQTIFYHQLYSLQTSPTRKNHRQTVRFQKNKNEEPY